MNRKDKRKLIRNASAVLEEKTITGPQFRLSSDVTGTPPEKDGDLPKFLFNGYNGGPVNLLDYGLEHPMYYNLTGLDSTRSVPILSNHYSPVGHTTQLDNSGSALTGEGVGSYPGPIRDELVGALKNGFPLQASMGLSVENESDITFLAKGVARTVNNRSVVGPAYIAEKSILNEMTMTMFGRDNTTSFGLLNEKAITMIKNSSVKYNNSVPVAPVAPVAAPIVTPVAPVAPVTAPSRTADYLNQVRLQRLMNSYPTHLEIIENGLKDITELSDTVLGNIENSLKLKVLENSLPHVPKLTPEETNSQRNYTEAKFAYSCGVSPEVLEKKFGKVIAEKVNNESQWGWAESLTMFANSCEKERRFTGHSDIEMVCNSLQRHNRQIINNGGFSSFDMPMLFKKVTDMQLEDRWATNEPFAVKYLDEVSNKDFRPVQRVRPGGGEIWQDLKNKGKIELTSFGTEKTYTTTLKTAAQLAVFGREEVYNDDMGVIKTLLEAMVEGAMIIPDMQLGQLMLNQASAASTFWVNSVNSFTGTPLNRANLLARYNAARQYNENRGRNIVTMIEGRWKLITSIPGTDVAWQLLKQEYIVNDTTANTITGSKNYLWNRMDMAEFPQMGNTNLLGAGPFVSDNTWVLWPAAKRMSPYTIAYLRGMKKPMTEVVDLPADILGFGVRGVWDVSVNERENQAIVRAIT